ncbi:MAG: hypothetical protein K5864_01140 [Bacteroidales bacterium]|nr:hypothetical protein [Bacteroidales bacterium]
MRKRLSFRILTTILLLATVAEAQNLRLTHVYDKTYIGFDLNRLYDYNLYERNRWGLGFNITTPLHYDNRYGTDYQNSFFGEAYAAWGSGDHGWKYGVRAELRFPRSVFRKAYAGYFHDIEKAGRHNFSSYNIFNTSENTSYTSSNYSEVDRLLAGVGIDLPGKVQLLTVEYRHSAEALLFDGYGNLLYPHKDDSDRRDRNLYDEMRLQFNYGKGLIVEALGGIEEQSGEGYWRLLGQYSRKWSIDSHGTWLLFVQAGITGNDNTPITRRYDLSGTSNSFYYFHNSMLTVPPNAFTADLFTHLCVSYTMCPLWKSNISSPRCFVQLSAMWGGLWSGDSDNPLCDNGVYLLDNGRHLATPATFDGNTMMALAAPMQGIIEPAAGIENLLHWGYLNIGVAAAYQLTPSKAPYHRTAFADNFAIMAVATISLNSQT